MKNLSALLKILLLFVASDCYDISPPAKPLVHSETVTLKPNSYWCHELIGNGVVRVVTDFHEKGARIYPMVLDASMMEKCKNDEPYMTYDLDGCTPLCPQWSHTVVLNANYPDKKYYIVLRNDDDREHSFGLLMYPS